MRALDRLAEVAHHHDHMADTLGSINPETRWAVAAEAQYSRGNDETILDGVLSHDGQTLSFIAWSGRRVLEAPFSEILVMRSRNRRLHLRAEDLDIMFEPFESLSSKLGKVPGFAAGYAVEIDTDDPFAGLLSWLPSAANVL